MAEKRSHVLVINPGSTSTKVGFFGPGGLVGAQTLRHADDELAYFDGVIGQRTYRAEKIREALVAQGLTMASLEAVVGRGGLLKPLASGTYTVNEAMKKDLALEARGSHASNLGGLIAAELADEAGCPAFIVDPVSVDELEPVARISGCSLFERTSLSHALNTKAVAKRFAAAQGRPYRELRLLVAHLGSGVSVSAHIGGRMVDVNNSREEGPFAPDRSGTVPCHALLDACFAGTMDKKELGRKLFSEGGVCSYLGTKDMQKAVEMIRGGDEKARLVIEAMVYQIAKEMGAVASVLEGRMDGIIVTGGIAQNEYVMERLKPRLAWLGEVTVYPGEDELQALNEGVRRVLDGQEEALEYV